jgi:hypothetical protein
MSRWEVFTQKQHPDLKPTNYNAILPHLGYKTITSCNAGMIRLNGGKYWLGDNGSLYLGDKLINLMKRVEGKNIIVYWLDDNQGMILKALVYLDTQKICEAVTIPTFNRAKNEWTAADHEAYKVSNSYIKTIEAYGRKRKNEIEPVTIIDNSPKPKKTFSMPGRKAAPVIDGGAAPAVALPEIEMDTEITIMPERSFVQPLKNTF